LLLQKQCLLHFFGRKIFKKSQIYLIVKEHHFYYSFSELIFSIINIIRIFLQFRRNYNAASDGTRQLIISRFVLFSCNFLLMASFVFLPNLAVLIFYLFFGENPLLNLISLSIFLWHLPVHYVANIFLIANTEKEASTPAAPAAPAAPEEHEMSLL
jgi:hypothetical protein